MTSCQICFGDIDSSHAVIDNKCETGKYHPECIQTWITTSRCGILTQFPIETYTIFENDKPIATLNVDTFYNNISMFFNELSYNFQNLPSDDIESFSSDENDDDDEEDDDNDDDDDDDDDEDDNELSSNCYTTFYIYAKNLF